jgi:hypothetical protein
MITLSARTGDQLNRLRGQNLSSPNGTALYSSRRRALGFHLPICPIGCTLPRREVEPRPRLRRHGPEVAGTGTWRRAHLAFLSPLTSTSGCASPLRPTGTLCTLRLFRSSLPRLLHRRNTRYGWVVALTRQGLSPCKMRRAFPSRAIRQTAFEAWGRPLIASRTRARRGANPGAYQGGGRELTPLPRRPIR